MKKSNRILLALLALMVIIAVTGTALTLIAKDVSVVSKVVNLLFFIMLGADVVREYWTLRKKASSAFSYTSTLNSERCEDCHWRHIKRHQKCSCCRRNPKMKDNYVFYTEDDTDDA